MNWLAGIYNIIFLGHLRDRPGPFDAGRVKKILVVRNDNIGDVICSTPALVSLRQAFPKARLAALVCTLAREVMREHPMLDELYVYPKAKHRYKGYGKLRSWYELWKTLRAVKKEKFDLAICLRSDFSTSAAWLVYASDARWKAGAGGQNSPMSFFYNTRLTPPNHGQHEVKRTYELLRNLGLKLNEEKLCIALPETSKRKARDFIEKNCYGATPLVVNLGYWPYEPARNWSSANYHNLLKELKKIYGSLVVTHGPGQEEWVRERILQDLDFAPAVFYSDNLLDLAALYASSALVVSVDGGPMHVAAAAGAAMVCLSSPAQKAFWHPWQVPHNIIEFKDNVNEITVEAVLDTIVEFDKHKDGLSGHGAI